MPGRLRETLLVAVIAIVLGGCGSDDDDGGTIPEENANTLIGQLDAVERAIESADCDLAESHANEFVNNVDLLPAQVGVETKEALREAGLNLTNLAAEQCAPPEETEEPTTEPTITEETEPETTTTTTTTDETTTEETTTDETTTEETTTEEEPSEGEPPFGQGPGGEGEDGGPATGGFSPENGGEG